MATGKLHTTAEGFTTVRIRTTPSLSADFVSMPIGTVVTLLGPTSKDADGFTWHEVQYDNGKKEGWVREDVIQILPAPPPTPVGTLLYFETDKRQVRVFDQASAVLMNVYNKKTNTTEVNGVAATKLPASSPSKTKPTHTYMATVGGRSFHASFIQLGETNLRIVDSATGKDVEAIENGFKADGSEYR